MKTELPACMMPPANPCEAFMTLQKKVEVLQEDAEVLQEKIDRELEGGKRLRDAMRLLPAWFVERMMTDQWFFGLLLETGQVLCIEHIDRVRAGSNGEVWIDVEMSTETPDVFSKKWQEKFVSAPAARTSASVQASKIVMAFELAGHD